MENFYIFLDVDGVFNFLAWRNYVTKLNLQEKGFSQEFCPENLLNFNQILSTIRQQGFTPKIVISSCWRINYFNEDKISVLISYFKKYGIKYNDKYDFTPMSRPNERGARGYEIFTYLKQHNIKDNFVIIDDHAEEISEFYINHSHVLQTSGQFDCGLSKDDVIKFKKEIFPKLVEKSQPEKIK